MKRLLVVDDDKRNAEIIGLCLSNMGYEMEFAFSGKEAIQKFETLDPDGVLLDVVLPDMDGYDICRKFRSEQSRHIVILMISGNAFKKDLELGISAGADAYLPKPYSPQELREKVRHLFNGQLA